MIILCSLQGYSQPYGNEWIDFSQQYYSFDIIENGVYRIDYNKLLEAGIPLSSIDPRNIQIFSREREVPILIEGEADGVFDGDEKIEFYASRNDGWLDSLIYEEEEWLNQPHYSTYNDTLTYFITWNDAIDNERIEIINNTNFSDYEATNYVWAESRNIYRNVYWGGPASANGERSHYFKECEGWGSFRYGFPSGSLTKTDVLQNPFKTSGSIFPNPILKTVIATMNNASSGGNPNHHIRISMNNNIISDSLFQGYQLKKYNILLNLNQLGEGSTSFVHEVVNDLGLEADYSTLSWTSLKYPHQLRANDSTDFHFEITPGNANDFIHLSLMNDGLGHDYIYSFGEEPKKIIPQITSGLIDALIPVNGEDVPCILSGVDNIRSIANLSPVGSNGFFNNYSSLNLDSAFVIITHPSLSNSANTYAEYRSNLERDAIVVFVNELYHQYGGGIRNHEIATRRFAENIYDTWDSKPAHLFLLGKSIQHNSCRKNETNFANNLVPSFGWPASDNLITAGLNNSLLEPIIATGRISAINEIQVENYLQKVSDFENQEVAEWMKNIMHFGGGVNASEQNLFKSYLEGYQSTIEDTCYSGSVHTFLKNSTLPIEVTLTDSISDLIANGVSIMTFFGHASGNSFDFSIDNPANLEWNEKYPLLIGNSCYTGNIHLSDQLSTSEDYVLIPNKGAIAFLANVNLGFSSALNIYTSSLYNQIALEGYGKSIGEQIQKAIIDIQGETPNSQLINTSLGMTLEGDPSLIINSPSQADISISDASILINEEDLDITTDSLDVKVILTNIGKATTEVFEVELIRHFPSGQEDSTYFQAVNGLLYKDTITFTIPLDFINTIGLNTFDVSVDLPENTLAELDDFSNNTGSTAVLISIGSVLPGYPYNFAIVGEENISLKASTGNPFEVEKNYRFEIDTISTFNSNFKQSHDVSQTGGVLNWPLPFSLTDSTVYYWRVSVDSSATVPYQWNKSSFQFIAGQGGWSQARFDQLEKNNFNNIIYNTGTDQLDFLTGSRELKCQVRGNNVSSQESSQYNIDSEVIEYGGCTNTAALHVAIIDPQTLDVWGTNYQGLNPNNEFGQLNQGGGPCRNRVENYFIFQQNSTNQMDSLQSLLDNKIPVGHYLLIYTWRFASYSNWDSQAPWLYDKFIDLGANEIGTGESQRPFIFMTKMGDPNSSVEIVGDTIDSYIELYYDLDISGSSGRMRSGRIGPAHSWDRLWWDTTPLEVPLNDVTNISIIGITENGNEIDIPLAIFDGDQTDEENLINYINQEDYPYLRLEANFEDINTQTPAQIDAWHVNYGLSPDAAINPQISFEFHGDTLSEGETLRFHSAIENISDVDMDSLLVSYWVESNNQTKHVINYPKSAPLSAGESLIDTITFDTEGFVGLNKFWIEINPYIDSLACYDQLEQYHFNNIAQLPFFVTEDEENPILDVVFDGIHILDGELVSGRPNIIITLDDENPYLLMDEPDDTAFFTIFLTDPNDIQTRMNFEENENYSLIFTPANGVQNVSKLEFNPILPLDGQHKLLVIASDKSGNASGDLNYEINFEVDHESRISEVLNYPNPFSTKTHFVFTLSGDNIPDFVKIQIMTVSGRIVKTIFQDELGPIRIGRNITDYFWDGRDDFGDQLANGIYIYKVSIQYLGEDIDYRATSASKYFKKGFGKMYLMR